MVSRSENNYVLPPVDENAIDEDDCFPLITSVYSLADTHIETKVYDDEAHRNSPNAEQSNSPFSKENGAYESNLSNKHSNLSKPIKMTEYAAVEDESPSGYKMVCKKGSGSREKGSPTQNGKTLKTTEYTAVPDSSSAGYKMIAVQSPKSTSDSKAKQITVSNEQTAPFNLSSENFALSEDKLKDNTEKVRFKESPSKAVSSSLIDLGKTHYGPMTTNATTSSQPLPTFNVSQSEETKSPGQKTEDDTSPLSKLEKRMTELVSSSQPSSVAGLVTLNGNTTKPSPTTTAQQQKMVRTCTPKGTFLLNVPADTQTVYIVHYQDGTRFFTVPQGTNLSQATINALARGQQVVIQKAVLPPLSTQNTSKSLPQPIAPKPEPNINLTTAKPSINLRQTLTRPLPSAETQPTNVYSQSNVQISGSYSGDSILSTAVLEQHKVSPSKSQVTFSTSGPDSVYSSFDQLENKPTFTSTSSSPKLDSTERQTSSTVQANETSEQTTRTSSELTVCSPSLSFPNKAIVSRSLFPSDNSKEPENNLSGSPNVSSLDSTATPASIPAEGSSSSSGDNESMDTGLSPHEAKIRRLKELMRQQEEALDKLREKRKREIESVRESAKTNDSRSDGNLAADVSKITSASKSGTFLTPAPPKSSSPFARSLQRTNDHENFLHSTPAKKQKKDETLNKSAKCPKGSTENTQNEEQAAFVPNGEDQKFVRLVGLETVVSSLSNKENCDKLDR